MTVVLRFEEQRLKKVPEKILEDTGLGYTLSSNHRIPG